MRSIVLAGWFLIVVSESFVASASAEAAVRLVPSQYFTIQAALDASVRGDVVRVAPGTYHENLWLSQKHVGVRLESSNGPDVTVLDGGSNGTVVTCSGVDSTTTIEGFTITHRGRMPKVLVIGGGLRLENASPIVRGNKIVDNQANIAAGIYIDGGAPLLLANEIRNNDAYCGSGGGIYLDHGSRARIENNVISDNMCTVHGGGIVVCKHSAPRIVNNRIEGNHACAGGGLFVTGDSHVVCEGNVITGSDGSGIAVQDLTSTCDPGANDLVDNTPANFVQAGDPRMPKRCPGGPVRSPCR